MTRKIIAGTAIAVTAITLLLTLSNVEASHPSLCMPGEAYDEGLGRCVPIGDSTCPFGDDENHCTMTPPPEPPDPPTKVNTICPQENVQHWDKIIFEPKLKGSETKILIPTDPSSELTEKKPHDIKILDDPETVVNLGRAVAQKLNELGYLVEKQIGPDKTTTVPVSETNIKIKDVEYAIACVSNAVAPEPPSEI